LILSGVPQNEVIFMRDKFTRYPMHDTRLLLLIALKLAIFADAGI
jgi:hypothetical protein